MSQDLTHLKSLLVKNIESLRREYHVRRFGVFGSFARGEATEKSDIDILVELSQPIGLFKFIELEQRLNTP